MCMNVDLPEPDGPMTATNSPGSIVQIDPRQRDHRLVGERIHTAQTADFDDGCHQWIPRSRRRAPPAEAGCRSGRPAATAAPSRSAAVAGDDLRHRRPASPYRSAATAAWVPLTSVTLTGTRDQLAVACRRTRGPWNRRRSRSRRSRWSDPRVTLPHCPTGEPSSCCRSASWRSCAGAYPTPLKPA